MDHQPGGDKSHEDSRRAALHAVFSFLIAVVVLAVAVAVAIVFVLTKPEPEKKEELVLVPTVRVRSLEQGNHRVLIETQGVVGSVHEVSLAAEVGGRVLRRSEDFIVGGGVSQGEVLVEIDAADYQAALARAESGLADARVALAQEQALADQAAVDWNKLGRGTPGELVLRKPQIAAAVARIESAEAEVARARRDLERTMIRAPFDARVRRATVDAGAVVAPGTPVGDLYSAGKLEVRLPFPLLDFGYLDPAADTRFELSALIGGVRATWPARLVRVEGEVERTTLSGYGIAEVMPDARGGLPPVGLFVEAVVPGKTLEHVVLLPRAAVRGSSDVWVVRDGCLQKRRIEVLRSGRDTLVARGDFVDGDQLVLTRLAAPLVGMKVEIEREEADEGS